MPSRLSLLAAFLLLAALSPMAGAAQGAPLVAAPDPLAFEEPFEEEAEEGEVVETECDTAHEEADEGELGRDEAEEICEGEAEADESRKKDDSGGQAPEECVLRSAHGHAAVNDKTHKLKLTLGYTAYESTGAKIKVGNIATVQRQLGRSGVLRIVKSVGKKAPKRLTIKLDVAAVPGYCGKYLVEKIKVR